MQDQGTWLADMLIAYTISFKLSKILTARELLTLLTLQTHKNYVSSYLFTFLFLVRMEFMSVLGRLESDKTRYPPRNGGTT